MGVHEMEKFRTTLAAFMAMTMLAVLLSFAAGQTRKEPASDRCSRANDDYLATERSWSSVNAEVGFMREDLERLRNLRWEVKVTLNVLDDALKILEEKGSLSSAQRMTLNARIPNNRGTITPDGNVTAAALGTAPMPVKEAKEALQRLLAQAEDDLKKTESALKNKEQESHLLSQRLAGLEEAVEKECRAAGSPTPWEQGVPRVAGKDLAQRYMEREQMRQQEVEGRRSAYSPYSSYPYPFPGYSAAPYPPSPYYSPYQDARAFPPRALLIELKDVSGTRTCLRCYPYRLDGEDRWILDQLEGAAHHHEEIPCVGRLASFRVIESFFDVVQCYRRAY
jgi:hypothetical protein